MSPAASFCTSPSCAAVAAQPATHTHSHTRSHAHTRILAHKHIDGDRDVDGDEDGDGDGDRDRDSDTLTLVFMPVSLCFLSLSVPLFVPCCAHSLYTSHDSIHAQDACTRKKTPDNQYA